MDRRLQILQELYGEGEHREEARRLLAEEPALWEEYQALSEARFQLDHRKRQRPDAAVLDTLFAAAAGEAPPTDIGRRADRRPVAHRYRLFRGFGVGAAVLAMVMLAGTGLWRVLGEAPAPPAAAPSTAHVAAEPPPPPASRSRLAAGITEPAGVSAPAFTPGLSAPPPPEPTPPADAGAGAALALLGGATPPADADTLTWDEAGDVLEMHKRIEMLEASVDLAWDEPAVPLEALPAPRPGGPGRALHQTGTRARGQQP